MRRIGVAVGLLMMASALPALARESELQISPRAGHGELKIDAFRGVNEKLEDLDTLGLGVSFGFLTPVGVLVEVGEENYGNFDLFDADDEFRLVQRYIGIGYQFELGDGWRLVPKVGRSHWKLTSEEGQLFNPGPEETRVIRGDEYFWEIGFGRRVSKVMALGASVRSGDYDFGRASSLSFVMTFGF